MPSIHYLNPPPNPFWDFVAGMEDHPFFAAYGPPHEHAFRQRGPPPFAQQPNVEPQSQANLETSEKAKGKQASVEDPPEVDPVTLQAGNAGASQDNSVPEQLRGMPFRGRGRFGKAFAENNDTGPEDREGREGHHCRGRGGFGRGGFGPRRGHGGPPPFWFGAPWFASHGPAPGPDSHGPPGHGSHSHDGPEREPHSHSPPSHVPHPHGPHGHGHSHGPQGQGPDNHGPPHCRWGPRHSPDRHEQRRGPPPHHGRGRPERFNLGEFLNNLGERLGVDVSGAAEGLGLDRFTAPRVNSEVDFEPRADVFENESDFTVHLSLPGAKKEDVGVDYDGENSVLHVAGVVHRPGVDENMLKQLVVDGRKRETGVFEKAIRLGTKRDPASVDVAAISAKMTDGVLVIRVPKVEVEYKKREVPIHRSATQSPDAHEKATIFDADQETYGTTSDLLLPSVQVDKKELETTMQQKEYLEKEPANEQPVEQYSEKEMEVGEEGQARQDGAFQGQLPAHETENLSDWEKYSDDENEGEYVKINVD